MSDKGAYEAIRKDMLKMKEFSSSSWRQYSTAANILCKMVLRGELKFLRKEKDNETGRPVNVYELIALRDKKPVVRGAGHTKKKQIKENAVSVNYKKAMPHWFELPHMVERGRRVVKLDMEVKDED